jgi:glycine cleavage system H protein
MSSSDLKFAKSHEWAKLDGDVVTIGISKFAVNLLTDLVYIELPSVGDSVSSGDSIGEIESVKAVSDLYSSVTGEIVEINDSLEEDLGVLTEDPYGKGWIVKIKIADPSELDQLMDEKTYDELCQSEAH